jgi:hypothetical protein
MPQPSKSDIIRSVFSAYKSIETTLMSRQLWDSPRGQDVYFDFWTAAYQAIDD